jgi:hypothetical protein
MSRNEWEWSRPLVRQPWVGRPVGGSLIGSRPGWSRPGWKVYHGEQSNQGFSHADWGDWALGAW